MSPSVVVELGSFCVVAVLSMALNPVQYWAALAVVLPLNVFIWYSFFWERPPGNPRRAFPAEGKHKDN